jgi:hypothetical protein
MYQAPGEEELLVREHAKVLLGEERTWNLLTRSELRGCVLEPPAAEAPNPWGKIPERPLSAGPCSSDIHKQRHEEQKLKLKGKLKTNMLL